MVEIVGSRVVGRFAAFDHVRGLDVRVRRSRHQDSDQAGADGEA
jgi:hypothetical protein